MRGRGGNRNIGFGFWHEGRIHKVFWVRFYCGRNRVAVVAAESCVLIQFILVQKDD